MFRIGILGGENEADRLKNHACWQEIVEKEFGVPVELYPAADYAGVIQGLIAGNLEAAELGSSAYAGLYLQAADAVEPLVTYKQVDGSTGYYSVLYVKSGSPYQSVDDLEGKTLAFADPNSTSGYLVPSYELKKQGYDPEKFFSQANFAGGHEQGVVAVLNDQYDAGVTWSSMVGDPAEGYSNGNLHKMVEKGVLDMKDLRILWQSELITNGPVVIRKSLPEELKTAYEDLLLDLPKRDQECFFNISGGEAMEYVPIEHDFYNKTIEMRRELGEDRRG
ncbi:MAG: phosphonate ABC transporter substrate-binding protein [Rhizobiales bacterium]|nr:phosphonate ABC transporter substrate-binding protein [Hyphomicrobiales bacterium]